ncbi:MAG TPA: agmatinase [Bacteroidales bacterium]|nr:MAG: agmatinase [Bacteroidetes bacterium GWE2_42_24]OFY25239.1 MAG: agmatinase [Bacteroidetes bacterium GWF2_43_11]HAQ65925.1 agmatinase [Bacteroidales bacterium]HBZ66940.1 agmatinase [Bacteroidales bacterium]
MSSFDPNGVAVANGNFMGLPYTTSEAQIILLPVPWDVTTSYRPGTSSGPAAIMEASLQLDLYDADLADAWQNKIAVIEASGSIVELNVALRPVAEEVIDYLANGGDETDDAIYGKIQEVNNGSAFLNDTVTQVASNWLDQGKIVGVIGGEHSVPLGLITELARRYPDLGILHIDAHADLREAYEGFTCSHASIMFNALKRTAIKQLVQVAVRDFCQDELDLAGLGSRVSLYTDVQLASRQFEGETWNRLCEEIVSKLPSEVYISFDIDGLSPDLCPNTGTPVPGGLTFRQAEYLLRTLVLSGRKIVGFDLCEVAPGSDGSEWDANVGARVLQKLCNLTALSQ